MCNPSERAVVRIQWDCVGKALRVGPGTEAVPTIEIMLLSAFYVSNWALNKEDFLCKFAVVFF